MRLPLLAAALILAAPVLAACTENGSSNDPGERALTVSSTDEECTLSADEAPAGTLTFDVTNDGSRVTEFYLLAEDGQRIVGEVENIGPNLTRQLVVDAPAGSYVAACKPGMKGNGVRAAFTVSESDEEVDGSAADQALVERAEDGYQDYVHEQSGQLLARTGQFVAAYKAGDDDAARAIYADARTHWEGIETVAESFGDLDPRFDAPEADLEPRQ
jgi:iron uptake system component EfeO